MTTAPFLSRPLGNFLLIAQLSEDALGVVFRAIYAPDERRFVRLRILQSPEISPEAIFSAVENNASSAARLVHRAIVPNAEVGLADNVPYFAWDEVAGWTLDQLLERVRTLGVRIPAEYALLVTEHVASALEFAHRAVPGKPIVHGLIWPGFVSISSNAEIRLGGFGLAEAILNSIHRPRIGREVAPYAAPEARETGDVGPDADVYSLGVLLTELLTGRHPRRQNPAAALTDSEVPEELRALLVRALAPSGERFASVVEMHRAVQELLTASPYALYSGNLALFLYRLLNPEGQNVVDAADGDATNPVEAGADIGSPDSLWKTAEAEEIDAHMPPFTNALPLLMGPFEEERGEPRFQVALAPLPALPEAPAPPKTAWVRRIGLAAAAALLATGVFLPRNRSSSAPPRDAAAIAPTSAPTQVAAGAQPSLAFAQPPTRSRPIPSARTGDRAALRKPEADPRAAQDRLAAAGLARRSAENLRLRAALSRVEAERLDAGLIARDLYAEAQSTEKEGDRLLRKGAYGDAQPVLTRATLLYRMAEDVSRQERVRLVRLSSPQ